MTELEKYRLIGTVDECRRAVRFYNEKHKPRHAPEENCKTCKKRNDCKSKEYSVWCVFYEN